MSPTRIRSAAIALCACAVAALVAPGSASGAIWVIKGHGLGHGVGMSQYGAYGFAKHGKGYRGILGHYYKRTTVGKTRDRRIRVLLDSGPSSVGFGTATRACGRHLGPRRAYRFVESGSNVILRTAAGHKLAN